MAKRKICSKSQCSAERMAALINLFRHLFGALYMYTLGVGSAYFVLFSHHWPDEVPFVSHPSSASFPCFRGEFIKFRSKPSFTH